MTPEQIAKQGSEDAHQAALFAKLNEYAFAHRDSRIAEQLRWVHAIPNGGFRHKVTAGRLKATGAKSGVADIFVPVMQMVPDNSGYHQYAGMYVEMKKPDERPVRETSKGGLSDEQIIFRDFVTRQGYAFVVCYNYEEAFNAIITYLGGTP